TGVGRPTAALGRSVAPLERRQPATSTAMVTRSSGASMRGEPGARDRRFARLRTVTLAWLPSRPWGVVAEYVGDGESRTSTNRVTRPFQSPTRRPVPDGKPGV